MAKKLSVGDRVLCRFYNTPDGKFYGDIFTAIIMSVPSVKSDVPTRDFEVLHRSTGRRIPVQRKEILRRHLEG